MMMAVVSSFAMETYETITIWELLSAELRGRQERIEEFLNSPETINLFHTQSKIGWDTLTRILSLTHMLYHLSRFEWDHATTFIITSDRTTYESTCWNMPTAHSILLSYRTTENQHTTCHQRIKLLVPDRHNQFTHTTSDRNTFQHDTIWSWWIDTPIYRVYYPNY